MRHHLAVIREFGIRYWTAWQLVRLAYRVKDTTYYQVIRTVEGAAVLIEADTWGAGVTCGWGVHWSDDDTNIDGWPVLREFDDHDAALQWFGGHDAA